MTLLHPLNYGRGVGRRAGRGAVFVVHPYPRLAAASSGSDFEAERGNVALQIGSIYRTRF